MPKIKTHKASAKRFRVTKSGQVLRLKRTYQHFARHGSHQALRGAKQTVPVFEAEAKKVKVMLGA